MDNNLIPITEYASMIGKSPVSVRQKCQRGMLSGAVKLGRDWLIPADAPYTDKRITSGKYKDWRKKTASSSDSSPE